MGIRFEAPIWLLLLLPSLLVTVIPYLAARRGSGGARRRAALGLRVDLLGSLIFARGGLELVLPVNRLATVFVVDLSDSVGEAGRQSALAFIRDSLTDMPDGDAAGIVAFGKDALVERLPQDLREIDPLPSTPLRAATDVGAAPPLAAALFPDAAPKRSGPPSGGNDTTRPVPEEA